MKHCARVIVGALLSAAAFAAHAAITFSFDCITANSGSNCGIGETQLKLTLSDGANGTTNFLFTNTGTQASSITDIYFDWKIAGLALAKDAITQSAGVSFSWDATPADLPAGNTIGFSADIGLDSNNPTQPWGINPGEWLNIAFAGSFNELVQGLHSGDLQVGLHVQGFSSGPSGSFVSIPEPAVYALLLVAVPLLGFAIRRRETPRAVK